MADFFWKLLLLSVVLTHRWWAQESPVLCWLPSSRRWLAAAAQLLWSIYYQWLVAELGTGQTCKTCRTWQVNGHVNRLVPVDVWGRFFRPIHQFHVETTIFHACLQKCERARRQLGKNAGTLHSKHCKTSLTCLAQGIMIAVCQPATRGQWGDVTGILSASKFVPIIIKCRPILSCDGCFWSDDTALQPHPVTTLSGSMTFWFLAPRKQFGNFVQI